MRRFIFIAYLVLLHGFIGLMLWDADFVSRVQRKLGVQPNPEITDHYKTMLRFHVRMDGNVPDRSVVFIGDSLTQGLCSDAIASPSVNYGIGTDTTLGVLTRMPNYRSLFRASAIVLAIGLNDLKFRDNQQIIQNYGRILEALPQDVPIFCSAVLPLNESVAVRSNVNNARICELNEELKMLCIFDKRCVFVDIGRRLVDASGNLSTNFHDGDGIHLNAEGNQIWIDELRKAISKVQQVSAALDSECQTVRRVLVH